MAHLVVRADGGPRMGMGHVMRCLALAQGWQDEGGRVTFVTAAGSPAVESRLRSEGLEVLRLSVRPGSSEDALQTAEVGRERSARWIVVDGYHFGGEYQRAVKKAGASLLFIDDNGHAPRYYANVVLNQNAHASEDLYAHREPYTRLLLGTRYALLRREFRRWGSWKRETPEVARRVLVTLGGADPDKATLKVIQALREVEVEGLEAAVVTGLNNSRHEELRSAVMDSPRQIRLEHDVNDMPELMAWADVATSAAGTTHLELAFMGLPGLALILADNQRHIAEELDEMGVAVNLGWHENLSPAETASAIMQLVVSARMRAEMTRRGRELVDGEGVERVLMHLRGAMLRSRQAREDDCRLLWTWANDPVVRANAFSTEPIPWEEHERWFKRKLHQPNSLLFIALDDQDTPVGQVRFEVENDGEAEIHVSVDPGKRGSGYGSSIISTAVEKALRVRPLRVVHAFIKPDNRSSIKAFERAKFKRSGMETMKGNAALHYVRVRDSE